MNENKEFESDKIVTKTQKTNFNITRIFQDPKEKFKYINSSRNYRKIIEYGMCIHFSLNFTFWFDDNYGGNLNQAIKSNKFIFFSGVLFFGITFIDDIIYILFRRHNDEGLFRKFLQYEKNLYLNFKNSFSKIFSNNTKNNNEIENKYNTIETESNTKMKNILINKENIQENSQLILHKIHTDLRELERKQKELKEKIKMIPKQDISYVEVLEENKFINEKKRKLILQLREYNNSV
jgi:hypothetical protein